METRYITGVRSATNQDSKFSEKLKSVVSKNSDPKVILVYIEKGKKVTFESHISAKNYDPFILKNNENSSSEIKVITSMQNPENINRENYIIIRLPKKKNISKKKE